MQKRACVLLVIPILFLFLISFISAAGCGIVAREECVYPNTIVMGVSAETNAHGENASEENYESVLCCDFPSDGYGSTTCTSLNKIIGLSASTNAHAEIPSSTLFSSEFDICYEDLVCNNVDTTIAGNCDAATEGLYPLDMLSLSSSTNAHLGEMGTYPLNSICCSSLTHQFLDCELTKAYWSLYETDSSQLTEEENPVDTGRQVYLVVEGSNACFDEQISLEILENDGESMATLDPVPFGTKGVWTTEWIEDGWFQGNPEYYFIATVVESSPIETIEVGGENLLLEVTPEILDCNFVTCAGYDSESDCNSDSGLCDVGKTDGEYCDEFNCFCSWNDETENCFASFSPPEECGNEIIDGEETCETDSDVQQTCEGEGLGTGIVTCVNCQIDYSGCSDITEGICGDEVINIGENCDSGIGASTCEDFDGFTNDGNLGCSDLCQFDTSLCTGGEVAGTCTILQEVTSECEEEPVGLFIYSWNGTWEGLGGGTAKEVCLAGGEGSTVECPAQVQLPIDNVYGLILAVALIALIYFFWIKKKQKKNSKKSSGKRRKK